MILLTASSSGQVASVQQLEQDLASLSSVSERAALIDTFMQQVSSAGTPLIENDSTAVFIYHGPAKNVRLSGDMTHWGDAIELSNIPGTDVHYYRGVYPADARLEYVLILDDGPPIPDPLCPNKVLSGLGALSELAMPRYQYDPVFQPIRDGTVGNDDRLEQHLMPAGHMGYQTEIHVYTPPGYEMYDNNLPTIYLQDGRDYIEYAYTPTVLDQLITAGAIEPVIAVFISPPNRHQPDMPNRMTEYGLNPDYARFMAEELVPYVEQRYNSRSHPSARLVAGPSFGGLVSVYVPFQHPDVFGLGYSQSGYLSFQSDALIEAYKIADRKPLRLYVDIGVYERSVGRGWLPDEEIDFLMANRRFNEVLTTKNYDLEYREYPEGHTWGNWRAHLIDALTHFFPGDKSR